MSAVSLELPIAGLFLAPLLPGVINRVKAFFAGRRGPPLAQLYYDLAKLLRKTPTYSKTTTWVFRASPIVGLACVIVCLLLTPLGPLAAPLHFEGDIVLAAYLLGLMRFMTVCAALDTGSAFEGMGASREVQFSTLAELTLFLSLAVLSYQSKSWSLSGMFAPALLEHPAVNGGVFALVMAALVVVFLTENSRVPVDDPNTHLELTMIHEVMILDHSGPDLAFIEYASSLKMWILGCLVTGLLNPTRLMSGSPQAAVLWGIAAVFLLTAVTGVVESCMARLRLKVVPRLITSAAVLAAMAFTFSLS